VRSWLRVTMVTAGLSLILAACGAPASTGSDATRPPGGTTVPAAPTASATATPAETPTPLPASSPPTRPPPPPGASPTPGPPAAAATPGIVLTTPTPTPTPAVVPTVAPTPAVTPTPTASPAVRGPIRDSTIQTSTFERHVRIVAGTTVVWTNADGLQHTVTAMDGSTDSPYLGAGESYALTFTTPGQFEFYCRPHLQMVTTVHVSAP
jgi:plastocyanin